MPFLLLSNCSSSVWLWSPSIIHIPRTCFIHSPLWIFDLSLSPGTYPSVSKQIKFLLCNMLCLDPMDPLWHLLEKATGTYRFHFLSAAAWLTPTFPLLPSVVSQSLSSMRRELFSVPLSLLFPLLRALVIPTTPSQPPSHSTFRRLYPTPPLRGLKWDLALQKLSSDHLNPSLSPS